MLRQYNKDFFFFLRLDNKEDKNGERDRDTLNPRGY